MPSSLSAGGGGGGNSAIPSHSWVVPSSTESPTDSSEGAAAAGVLDAEKDKLSHEGGANAKYMPVRSPRLMAASIKRVE